MPKKSESALKHPSTIAVPVAAMARTKLSLAESEDSTSRDNGKQLQNFETSIDVKNNIRASERQKEHKPQDDDVGTADVRTTSTNRNRQAVINAELALNSNKKHRDRQLSKYHGLGRSCTLYRVYAHNKLAQTRERSLKMEDVLPFSEITKARSYDCSEARLLSPWTSS